MKYKIEGEREAMVGTIVVGSKIGYEGEKAFQLEEMVKFVHEINSERVAKSQRTINCMVSCATLVGRATESGYQEEVYNVKFSISPRSEPITKEDFFKVLTEYGESFGDKAQQERIYLEFDDKVTILRRVK